MKASNYYKPDKTTKLDYLSLKSFAILVSTVYFILTVFQIVKFPEKYYFDSEALLNIANNVRTSYGDKSYQNVANLISFFHLNSSPILIKVLNLLIFYYGTTRFIATHYQAKSMQVFIALYLAISLFIGTVYYGQVSKEIVPLVLNVLFLVVSAKSKSSRKTFLFILGGVLFYAFQFRNYWAITAIVFILFELVSKLPLEKITKKLLLILTFSVAIYFVGLHNLGELGSIQAEINRSRLDSEYARSALTNYPTFLPEVLYWPYRLLSFFFPILLVANLSQKILLFSIFFTTLFTFLTIMYSRDRNKDFTYGIFFRYFCAHIIALSIFEPDYGSFIKHFSSFIPICSMLLTRGVIWRKYR